MNTRSNTFIPFLRYNIAAALATAVDFFVLVLLTEVFAFWYLFSAFIGAISGGVTSFLLERNWAFMKKDKKLSIQAIKYVLVWVTSIFLNTVGLYLIVEYLGLQYIYSKIIIALIIGMGFNFFMHKYYIFN